MLGFLTSVLFNSKNNYYLKFDCTISMAGSMWPINIKAHIKAHQTVWAHHEKRGQLLGGGIFKQHENQEVVLKCKYSMFSLRMVLVCSLSSDSHCIENESSTKDMKDEN